MGQTEQTPRVTDCEWSAVTSHTPRIACSTLDADTPQQWSVHACKLQGRGMGRAVARMARAAEAEADPKAPRIVYILFLQPALLLLITLIRPPGLRYALTVFP
jgi:hypothetical protein